MTIRRLLIRLRVLITLIIASGVVAGIASLIYLHEKGFSDAAGDRVAEEMERYGIYAEFDNLSFHLINGLTANNVRLFRSIERNVQIAELPALAIHVDKTKLMRGNLKINTISLTDAQLAIPLVRGEAQSPVINISDVSGSIDLPGAQSLSTTDLTGLYEGIRVTISCNIWRDAPKEDFVPDPESKSRRIAQYSQFLEQLQNWNWPSDSPPELKIFIEGNLSNPNKVDFDFLVQAKELDYKDYKMQDIELEGDWNQNLITLDNLAFSHQGERCQLVADFDLQQKNGRVKIDSTLHIQNFAKKVFNKRIMERFSSAGKTHIIASGKFQLPNEQQPKLDLQLTGNISGSDFSFNGASVNDLTTEFSWNNGDLYLDKLHVIHPNGKLHGRIIIKDQRVRYKMVSSLPARDYFPFIRSEPLKRELSKLNFTSKSYIDVHASGRMNLEDKTDWESHGHAELRHFSHNGVPVSYAQGKYRLDRTTATFTDLTATFDYSDYAMRKAYNGPKSGTLTAKSFHFDWPKRSTEIKTIRGTAWPAPVLRLFAPKIADHLENYKFHLPPTVSCSGLVSWAKGSANKMRLVVGFTSTGLTEFNFLKKNIGLTNIKGQVTVLPDKVQINKLSSRVFGGNASGYIHVTPSDSSYSGRFQWDKLRLKSISSTYGFKGLNQGSLTGSFTFRGKGSAIKTLNGHGNLALSNGDLFAVPLFGPLSSLIDSVVNPLANQQLLHERARDFSCNFSAKNGIFYSNDLTSMTPSTTFTGEGWIDLNKELLDITIRMNFRGLMGLAEVPMKVIELPFQALKTVLTGKEVKGLRQFRGSGKISSPNWQFTPFQPPRDGKNDPIFRKPPRAQVVK
ncbi:AsmA-like C-terminal region-containing protein [Rubritalea tangerina]|uniref:AsmA-like C-terminal region-containing protein n=1 Tax=Rubritalea tangerina TaxID=430798 RepID=A0ABW4ZFP9_9BACT